MAAFLVQFSYTDKGSSGMLKDGGTKRRAAVEQAVKSVGGRLVAYYFAFGDYDGIALVDGLDNTNIAAVNLAVAATGAVRTFTTVLLTPEEVDAATKKTVNYSPPGR